MSDTSKLEAYERLRSDIASALATADALGLVDVGIYLDRAFLLSDERVSAWGGWSLGMLAIPNEPDLTGV